MGELDSEKAAAAGSSPKWEKMRVIGFFLIFFKFLMKLVFPVYISQVHICLYSGKEGKADKGKKITSNFIKELKTT